MHKKGFLKMQEAPCYNNFIQELSGFFDKKTCFQKIDK